MSLLLGWKGREGVKKLIPQSRRNMGASLSVALQLPESNGPTSPKGAEYNSLGQAEGVALGCDGDVAGQALKGRTMTRLPP